MLDDRITVSVHATDEVGRARLARELRALPGIRVVRDGAAVQILLLGRHDRDAAGELRRRSRGSWAPLVVVADGLGDAELMAVWEYGARTVLQTPRVTPRRLGRAVHAAAGCCPPEPLPEIGALV
ncbi:DNA-binding response regulator [Streptomyces huiliensis]|uniref:DNA-binding response regulator n=1 Tax=Streptomyces huiliensis TaxID=2876027 RepID=UPI001CC14BE7|nr:DNA-binding response regulator [Streptomyces huiliensis]MBZ4317939.1 DNA-binding response regulator [Streptomyces huiliensis]